MVLCSGIVVMWCCVVALWGCFVLCGATFTYVINNHVYVLLYSCTDFHNLCTGIPESIFYSRGLEQNLGRNIQNILEVALGTIDSESEPDEEVNTY